MSDVNSHIDRWATFRPTQMPDAMYWHIPFCRHRCGYCNFTLVAGRDDLIDPFLEAIQVEVDWLKGRPCLDTCYWGGGTPSHLSSKHLGRLFDLLHSRCNLSEDTEFTVEMNPEDVGRETLALLADAGVNRISLGVQSFQSRKLRALDRSHSPQQARQAIDLAKRMIGNVAVDLIFACPGETPQEWAEDLESVLACGADHIATYDLTFEKGTAFWSRLNRGELHPHDDDRRIQLYRQAIDTLVAGGFRHYEVSNFCRPNRESRHNSMYWEGREYLAFGPGASRFVNRIRETNHRSVTTWLRRITRGLDPVAERERMTDLAMVADRIAFGMRKLAGTDLTDIRLTIGDQHWAAFQSQIDEFVNRDWLIQEGNGVRMTGAGLLLYDTIAASFVQLADSLME